jgi:hypothetical protein
VIEHGSRPIRSYAINLGEHDYQSQHDSAIEKAKSDELYNRILIDATLFFDS